MQYEYFYFLLRLWVFWKFCAIFRSNWSLVRFFRFFLVLLKVHFGPFEVLTCTFCWVWKNCLVNKDRLNCAKKTNNGSKVRTIWNSSVIITFSLLPTNRLLPFIDLFFQQLLLLWVQEQRTNRHSIAFQILIKSHKPSSPPRMVHNCNTCRTHKNLTFSKENIFGLQILFFAKNK